MTLTAAEISRLLDACDMEMRPFVELALLTGIDVGPLVRLSARDFDDATGRLRVPDTKNVARKRTLLLSAPAAAVVRRHVAGREGDEPMFSLTLNAITNGWRHARKDAGLPNLRMKDLRHVFATFWASGGGTLKDLQHALGHTRQSTTMRYTAHQAAEQRNQMDRVAQAMGLGRHLQIEETGS